MNRRHPSTRLPAAIAGALIFGACLSGCYESATLVTLRRDGSGTVVCRLYLSETMREMLQGDSERTTDPLAGASEQLGRCLGEAATLQDSRSLTNGAGWVGVEAIFAFDDINRVRFDGLDPLPAGDTSGPAGPGLGAAYRPLFTPGDAATLTLTPTDDASTSGGRPVDTSGLPLDTLRPILQGMRTVFLVSVDGNIVESNARFQSDTRPNLVTLRDIRADRLLDHPAGTAWIRSGGPVAELAALDIPGAAVEPAGKTITIRFQ